MTKLEIIGELARMEKGLDEMVDKLAYIEADPSLSYGIDKRLRMVERRLIETRERITNIKCGFVP